MRKMHRNALILVTGLIIATFGATPALAVPTAGVLYDIDFESEKVNDPPFVGASGDPAPRDRISFKFGNPEVVNGFGALTSQVLKFDGTDGGDGIELQMDPNTTNFPGGLPADGFYVVKSEILIASVATREFLFFIDAPTIRRISFKPDGTIRVIQPPFSDPISAGEFQIGTFAFNTKMNLRVEVDLFTDNWKIFLDGALLRDASFGAATELSGIRFINSVSGSPNVIAAIDNILVTAAFGPPPPTQLAACPLDPGPLASNCAASGGGFFIFHDPKNPNAAPAECACAGVASQACTDAPGADLCFEVGDKIRSASGISIVNKPGSFCTVYCFSLDGVRLCQEFCVP